MAEKKTAMDRYFELEDTDYTAANEYLRSIPANAPEQLKAKDEEIEILKAERDLFKGCCTRAFDKWLELHPDANPRPDGAVQIVEQLKAKDARIAVLERGGDAISKVADALTEKLEARVKELEEKNRSLTTALQFAND